MGKACPSGNKFPATRNVLLYIIKNRGSDGRTEEKPLDLRRGLRVASGQTKEGRKQGENVPSSASSDGDEIIN